MTVVRIQTGKAPSPVNERCVEMLEMLLRRVKAGEVDAVAYAAHCADGTTIRGIQDAEAMSALAAPIMALHHDYGAWLAEPRE